MDLLPISFSGLALIISLLNFWWNNVREKRALYLVRLHRLERFEAIDFALVNAGSKDLLITDIHIYFDVPEHGSCFYPSIKIDSGIGATNLITSGKALEYQTEFLEPFTSTFAQQGRKQKPWEHLLTHIAGIEVHWVDMAGKAYKAKVPHTRFGFEPGGKIRAVSSFTKEDARHELFGSAT